MMDTAAKYIIAVGLAVVVLVGDFWLGFKVGRWTSPAAEYAHTITTKMDELHHLKCDVKDELTKHWIRRGGHDEPNNR